MRLRSKRKQTGEVIVSYMPALNEVTQLFLYGELDSNSAKEVRNYQKRSSSSVNQFLNRLYHCVSMVVLSCILSCETISSKVLTDVHRNLNNKKVKQKESKYKECLLLITYTKLRLRGRERRNH